MFFSLYILLPLKIPLGAGNIWGVGGSCLSDLLGYRLHLSMNVDLYTFVGTCCLHFGRDWGVHLCSHEI